MKNRDFSKLDLKVKRLIQLIREISKNKVDFQNILDIKYLGPNLSINLLYFLKLIFFTNNRFTIL